MRDYRSKDEKEIDEVVECLFRQHCIEGIADQLTVKKFPTDRPPWTEIPPYQKASEWTKNPAPYAAACSSALVADVLVDSLFNGASIPVCSFRSNLGAMSKDCTIRTDERICSMKEEVFPSIGPLVTATASAQYPSAVNMTMVNGIKAKRTPASLGAWTKADTKACR